MPQQGDPGPTPDIETAVGIRPPRTSPTVGIMPAVILDVTHAGTKGRQLPAGYK